MSEYATRDLSLLHPLVKLNVESFLDYCKKQGYNVGISETFRTIARQDYLYEQGRTRDGNIVTYAKGQDMSSYHQWGLAVDFFQNIKGQEYDLDFMEQVGKIGEMFGFEWGGRFTNFIDMPHLQMSFGLSIQELKLGKKITDNISQVYIDSLIKLYEAEQITQVGIWLNFDSIKKIHIESLMIKYASKCN